MGFYRAYRDYFGLYSTIVTFLFTLRSITSSSEIVTIGSGTMPCGYAVIVPSRWLLSSTREPRKGQPLCVTNIHTSCV